MENNYISKNRPSQLGQDDKCLEFLREKRNGFYVDIGAFDGLDLSNTKKLEFEYDWTGICIEPILQMYNVCKDNRPNSIVCHNAISSVNGSLAFSVVGKDDYQMLSHIGSGDDDPSTFEFVDSITFTELLDKHNAPSIMDFLSLDTEGTELEILQSLDHNKYKFRFISVEHNYKKKTRQRIRDFLCNNGYTFYGVNQWDDMYIFQN